MYYYTNQTQFLTLPSQLTGSFGTLAQSVHSQIASLGYYSLGSWNSNGGELLIKMFLPCSDSKANYAISENKLFLRIYKAARTPFY